MFSNMNSSALEASSSSLPLPQAAITQTERSSIPSDSNSLGYNFDFSASTESRHDRRISADVDLELGLGSSSPDEPLPSYEEPPEYTSKNQDPATLAMYLFKFGFFTLFPPFWILGACILFTPLHAPDADQSTPNGWLPEKTEAERAAIIATLRKAELKWAWRCLFAILTISLFAIAAGVTIWAILRS